MGKLKIDILGTSFTIQSPADDEHLQSLLSYYKDITSAFSGTHDPLQISILSGLTLVDELLKEKQKSLSYSKELSDINKDGERKDKITLGLIEKIDRALK
ncbi:MAG: cell division protein ZapA [Treponema sp.]|nr:cell division protein ZapA [Treponema sp.]